MQEARNTSRPRRKKSRPFPKGRQLDATAVKEINNIIGESLLRRDHLIEYLHALQDHFGCLKLLHLSALAARLRISEAEVHEVASFYHHFDIVKEDEATPAPLTLRICNSLSCMLAGSDELVAAVNEYIDPAQVRIVEVPCIGRCDGAPACHLGTCAIDEATPANIQEAIKDARTGVEIPEYQTLSQYQGNEGYSLLDKVRSGGVSKDDVISKLSSSGLKGLGGAGFPAGKKWQIVRSYPGPRLMTVNADEGEPGTFKDRHYLENEPHKILEGTLVAAQVIEAERVYFYLRDEYPAARRILETEILALETAGIINGGYIELRRGAGAYICGEESAMIESIEGKRGLPRLRPPYIAERGLFNRPTLNHNVETLYWVPQILEKGSDWFESQGVRGASGLRSWSVSGRVRNPGVIMAPAGSTALELIELAGGMAEGHQLGGYLPGGASGGILPPKHADLPLDFGTLDDYGCFVGSHAVIILSTSDDLRDVARNLLAFFAHESCGQCTPCRVGCEKAGQLMQTEEWDTELLRELSDVMIDASICGLGQAAPNPILSILRYWPELIEGRRA